MRRWLVDRKTSIIRTQIERCRRLARMMVDDDIRHSLEELAPEYEEQLGEREEEGFMLRDRAPPDRP